jgi:hypothetical protein
MRSTLRNIAALVVVLLLAAPASATPIINSARSGPIIMKPGSETSVQQVFTQLFGTPGALDALANQTNIGSFRPTANTVFTYVRSIAGFGGSNEFWIYQSTNDVATARVE